MNLFYTVIRQLAWKYGDHQRGILDFCDMEHQNKTNSHCVKLINQKRKLKYAKVIKFKLNFNI